MKEQLTLGPVIALAAWTMFMWAWMYATRIPALQKLKVDTAKIVGTTGAGLDAILPPQIQWKAHNYNHLMEQPTVFYAVALALAIAGLGDGLNAQLAWAYVGLRVVHSLVQATVHRVMIRFLVFALSSLVLVALIVNAACGILL